MINGLIINHKGLSYQSRQNLCLKYDHQTKETKYVWKMNANNYKYLTRLLREEQWCNLFDTFFVNIFTRRLRLLKVLAEAIMRLVN